MSKISPSAPPELVLLSQGIAENDIKKMQTGIANGANVNYICKNKIPLIVAACRYKHEEVMEELLKQKTIDVTVCRQDTLDTVLHEACKYNLPTTVALLLETNPQLIDMRNKKGEIPLLVATQYGHIDCTKLLLAHAPTTIHRTDYSGSTALHLLCVSPSITSNKKKDILILLIENGACITIKNNYQITPLVHMFSNTHRNGIYATKPLINSTDRQNNTQLHLCATTQLPILTSQFRKYLRFLILQGVSVWAKNNDNKTALDLACEAYKSLYDQYIKEKPPYLKTALHTQEYVLHSFLCVTSPYAEYALFKELLQQLAGGVQLPKDVIPRILYYYYQLHIETIVAKKYKNNKSYYTDFIENKEAIKKQLRDKPENPELLWK